MSLDFALSDEQQALGEAIATMTKRFAGRREEFIQMILKEHRFPEELWQALCEVGLLGCLVPEEYGGNGMGLLAMAMGLEQLARRGLGNALLVLGAMDACCIVRCGNEEQKRRLLPRLASGEDKYCFAVTEPNAGSNTFRIETLARKEGATYRLSGEKTFITGADVADRMLLVARTTSAAECEAQGLPKAFGLSLFIVDTKARGIDLKPIPTHGIEGMIQYTVHLDGVEVAQEDLIGEPDQGAMALFNSLNPERILAAASALGMTDYLLERSCEYARGRVLFGQKPIAAYQAIQHPLARIKAQSEAVRLVTYKAAWAFDQGHHPGQVGPFANMAKYLAAEMAVDACDRAIQTHGGYGFSEEYGIIYLWTTARLLRTAPISQEMVLNFIGEHVLELPRSY
ncbi:MAG: acyl-CoA/acyl-ACP dehydrogenase [Planctomycetes bacterium]|nr:acyl-CoA/acyl-ACP dehydrogenase [Planctomycetota bacterium]